MRTAYQKHPLDDFALIIEIRASRRDANKLRQQIEEGIEDYMLSLARPNRSQFAAVKIGQLKRVK